MTLVEFGQLLQKRREAFGLTVMQCRQCVDASSSVFSDIERAAGRARGDIAFQYLQLLGGVLCVDSITIGAYNEFVEWYAALKKSKGLSNYVISKTTGIGKTSLGKLTADTKTHLNIDMILTILQTYSSELNVLWVSSPVPLLASHLIQDDTCAKIGCALHQARINHNISIFDMATQCNTRDAVLLGLEAGEGRASLSLALKYLACLKMIMVITDDNCEYPVNSVDEMQAWLIESRLKHNMTVLQLSNASKVSAVVIRNYEKGPMSTYFYSCVKLIHALGGKLLIRE